MTKRTQTVKQLYFMVVAIVTLAISLVSFGYIVYTIFDSYVFTNETVGTINRGMPPVFYLNSKIAPIPQDASVSDCSSSCTFTESDKTLFSSWKESYTTWKSQPLHSVKTRDLVNYLSFLIVAAPLFFWHFRMLRKDNQEYKTEAGSSSVVYSIYFYAAALGTLIVGVIFTALLINTTLKTWVITDASQNQTPVQVQPLFETTQLQAVIDCQKACGFSNEDVALAKEWMKDNESYQKLIQKGATPWQRDFSRSLAAMLVTLPVFWYHWATIRKDSKTPKQNVMPPAIS